ncbi:kinase-like protein [Aspergillus pseudonomiae]|nr:kinase-like protein [Aspergillus pseudonomiae]
MYSASLDEETLPTYQPEKYYPVNQGEILNDRYQTLAKIGYGVTSTVWLAKDLVTPTYVVLKIYLTGQSTDHERELDIYKHMNLEESKHPGRSFIRKLLDHFYIQGSYGSHVCLVHDPLGTSADLLVKMSPGQAMTLDTMKPGIRQLLIALDFLHSQCHIIHTDPPPRKVLKDRTIYKSLGFFPRGGLPILTDFGEARLGDKEHSDDIMPNMYRAPESIAMVAWDIVSPRTLINGKNSDGIFDDRVHMAELVALLGPPPPEFREQRPLSSVFWDESGNWKDVAPIPKITLESLAEKVEGEDKEGFFAVAPHGVAVEPQRPADGVGTLI